jgi:AraC family transcriptional regulator
MSVMSSLPAASPPAPARIMMLAAGRTYPLRLNPTRPEPLLNSATTSWAGIPFEEHRFSGTIHPRGRTGPLDGEHGLLVIMEGQIDIVGRKAGREVRYRGVPSSVSLLAGDHPREVLSIQGDATAVCLHIARSWFEQLSLDGAPSAYGLGTPLVPDATVHALVKEMREEVRRGATTGRIYAESLSLALLSYVVEQLPGASSRVRGGLSEAQCRLLRRTIRDRLHENLSLAELASLAGLSTRYFSRLFRQAFGTTPHRYVLEQRLAEGARLLLRGRGAVEVARVLGFCSQSHFTAAFRQTYGVTPRGYVVRNRAS